MGEVFDEGCKICGGAHSTGACQEQENSDPSEEFKNNIITITERIDRGENLTEEENCGF